MTGTKRTAGFKLLEHIKPIDIITFIYAVISGLYILAGSSGLANWHENILIRFGFIALIAGLIYLHQRFHNGLTRLLRNFYPIILLSYWYKETGYMNNIIFPDLDPYMIQLEQAIFGMQPSLEFSAALPQYFINELMNFGYFSYYFLNISVCLVVYLLNRREAYKTIFVVNFAFFIYYIIFSLFPVIGPQFYFEPPINLIPDAGFFRSAVQLAQHIGETETGAFPSSHVGIALILSWFALRNSKILFSIIIIPVIILCMSTVYIKAHYAVDVIADMLTAPLFAWLGYRVYYRWTGTKA